VRPGPRIEVCPPPASINTARKHGKHDKERKRIRGGREALFYIEV